LNCESVVVAAAAAAAAVEAVGGGDAGSGTAAAAVAVVVGVGSVLLLGVDIGPCQVRHLCGTPSHAATLNVTETGNGYVSMWERRGSTRPEHHRADLL